jgi:5-methylcytosine-specific restriction endonuclease McrA
VAEASLAALQDAARGRAREHEHDLGQFLVQEAFPATAFANCTRCGAGVLVDSAPRLPGLALDGEALLVACVPPNERTMDRAIKKRTFSFEKDGEACGFCKKPLGDGARYGYCSDACLHEAKVRNNPGYARQRVWERDQGRCAWCRRDCRRLALDMVSAFYEDPREFRRLFDELVAKGFPEHRLARFSLWDCDHIRQVRRGGGASGLENLQTLCVPCHRRKTRKWSKKAKHRDELERLKTEEWLKKHFPPEV